MARNCDQCPECTPNCVLGHGCVASEQVGLHACEVCGVELDGDDPNTRCEECSEPCSTCGGTGLVDWAPFQIRDTDADQQPCPDCLFRGGDDS